ncbi:hypothetical protein Patl1_20220 [Pistacia atlantica]|uniref:Uncharacterized protein n=1 Tax=Pistacia atlantica TaxID=434234 RepID=A0ACC1BJ99_9ROSI|nr:hypothetical protein Patl1_20220 [Pistacia atlantica]
MRYSMLLKKEVKVICREGPPPCVVRELVIVPEWQTGSWESISAARNQPDRKGLSYFRFAAMIIPEKNRKEICKYLFQEGVCYAKKDYNLAKHPEIDVPNLQVIKLMQSFKSREYVRETFAWMHYYWYLTNDGIEFLRTYLNLPSEIVPATLKKSAKPTGRPMGGPPGDRPRGPPRFDGDRPRFGDREGYRGGPRGGDFGGEKGGAPADFQPSFRMEFEQYKININDILEFSLGAGGRPGFGRGGGGYGAAPSGSGFP